MTTGGVSCNFLIGVNLITLARAPWRRDTSRSGPKPSAILV
jgi:hypothetical protein